MLWFLQCCVAGAGGAEIVLGPGAGTEINFKKHFLQSVWRMLFGFRLRWFKTDLHLSTNHSTAGPNPDTHQQLKFTLAISSLLNMHLTPRLHQTIEQLRQFIHLFTETNYLQTNEKKYNRHLFPHDAHGRVRVEASCRHLLVAVQVLSDLNLHNECRFK